MDNKRENWGTKLGLILAMAGNAIGLGNFWRFPYQASSHGGGAFMIPYFAALLILGIPVMLIEWNLGRFGGKYGHGTLGCMVYLQAREGINPKGAAIIGALCGMLAFGVTSLVNSYYNHIVGWTLGYSYLSITGGYMDKAVDTGTIFVNYIQNPAMVFTFWIIALAALGYAVMKGVQKGIETWARIMMPILYILGFVLIIRALTLGAPKNPDWTPIVGLNYLWNPDWSQLNFTSLLAAAGQIFFTLSLGMGIICNYASYLKSDDDIVLSSLTTISLNEFAEVILAGTIVIPITYTFLGPEALQKQSIGLSFIALPNIFRDMAGGRFFGAAWFLILFFAGFTSAIAMYNYLTTLLEEDMGIPRKKGAWFVFLTYIIVGLPVCLEPIVTKTATLAYFTEIDNWIGSYLLVVLGLIEIIVVTWMMGNKSLEEINRGSYWKVPSWYFNIFMKILAPIYCIIILVGTMIDYIKQGYLKLIPSFVAETPNLIPWVNGARIMLLSILVFGFIESYYSIKSNYKKELANNNVSIRM